MADISKLKVPAGTNGALVEYDVKDSTARSSIPAAASSSPQAPGTAAVGTSTKYAREDHVHPAQDISGKMDASLKGAANGVAELDSSGKVPTSQLPSYVDDVVEYNAKADFPATGETGIIYVDKSTNLTWRWGGSEYVEISPSLALGTTSSTAFRGDYGSDAYAHAVTNKGSAFTNGLYKITTNSEGHVTAATAVQKNDITALGIPATNTTYSFAGGTNKFTVTPQGGTALDVTVTPSIANATTSTAGLMSAADKTKLDGVATVIISETTPTDTEPTVWIDPSDDDSDTVLVASDMASFLGITLTTVHTITRT